MYKMCVKIDF